MACNNIGNKIVCESLDEARAIDRRTNGDNGDAALDTLAGVPQFFNATAKYFTMTDGFFGENRPWKGNFFSADVTVINNPLTRIAVGFPLNFAGGILNTVSVGYLKEGLDAVGLENHLSPPPSTKYEAYNYVNGNLLLLASALAVFVKFPPKAAAASQVATASEKASPATATTAIAVAEKTASPTAPNYVMGTTDGSLVPAPLTGNPGKIISATAYPEYPEGMLIRGWDKVENALRGYGRVKGSEATTMELVGASMQESGPLGAGLALAGIKHGMERGGGFIGNMLAEARAAIGKSGRWHRSYDYDAMGTPFFKTSLDITKGGNDLFTLKTCAAYVGDAPGLELAQAIGAPRVLKSATITLSLEPVAELPIFVVDFGKILGRLERVLGKPKITGKKLARISAQAEKWGGPEPAVVFKDPNFIVEVKWGNVEKPLRGENPFRMEGCQVSGICSKTYYPDREHHLVPTIDITVKFANKGEYVPANYPALLDLAEKIRQALTTEEPSKVGLIAEAPAEASGAATGQLVRTAIDTAKLKQYAAEADTHIKAGTQPEGGWFESKIDPTTLVHKNALMVSDIYGKLVLDDAQKFGYMMERAVKDGVPLTSELVAAVESAGDFGFSGGGYHMVCQYLKQVWKNGGEDFYGAAGAISPTIRFARPTMFADLLERIKRAFTN